MMTQFFFCFLSKAPSLSPAAMGSNGLVTDLLGESFKGIFATKVLVILLTTEVLGPVLMSHWVQGGLDEEDDLVLSVDNANVQSPTSTVRGNDFPFSDNGDGYFSIPVSSTTVIFWQRMTKAMATLGFLFAVVTASVSYSLVTSMVLVMLERVTKFLLLFLLHFKRA